MKTLLFTIITATAIFTQFSAQWVSGADIPQKIRAGNMESKTIDGTSYAFLFAGRNDEEIISDKSFRYNFSTNGWENLANMPTPLLGSSSAIIGDNIYIMGGLINTPGNATKKVYKYNIPDDLWSQVADMPNPYADGDAVAYQDSLIYIVGSYSGEKSLVYNINTNKWRTGTIIPSPGTALSYGALSLWGNKLIYVGGSNGTFSPTYWNNVWIGEIDQNDRANITWTAGAAFPGLTRTFFELRPWENGVILIGGTTNNNFSTVSNENYFYDPQLNTWTVLPSKPTAWNTGNAASIVVDGIWKLLCTGGFNTEYLKETEIYAQQNLSTSGESTDQCTLKNIKIISGKNPQLYFCTKETGNITIKIFDSTGKLIREMQDKSKSGQNIIGLQNLRLSTGNYFAAVSQNGVQISKKIQIVKNE